MSVLIAPYIQALMDLGPTIENNLVQVDRKIKETKNNPEAFNVSTPARTYVSLIRDKFPKAISRLVERLGEANWQRHVVVRDMMERGAETPQVTNEVKKAAVFSQFGPVSLFQDSGLGTSISAGSQSAPSMASHSSFVSSIAEWEQQSVRVPPTPAAVGEGQHFQCKICFAVQKTIRNRVDWK